ncbi:MAG: hypothetical protein RLP44_10360 [Aggregatilineales bacterium]
MSRMMRNALYIALLSVFMLTACGGGGDDTPAPEGATPEAQNQSPVEEFSGDDVDAETPNADATYYNEFGTIIPPEQVTPYVQQPLSSGGLDGFYAPPVGVLGAASTEEPIPGEARASGFDYIFYEQSGGINDETLRIEVYSDGRVTLDGESVAPARSAEIEAIATLMDEINFFGMQGTFLGPAATDDTYYYRMGASQNEGLSRLIQARDGFMPPEIIRLFALVRGLVEDIPETSG